MRKLPSLWVAVPGFAGMIAGICALFWLILGGGMMAAKVAGTGFLTLVICVLFHIIYRGKP